MATTTTADKRLAALYAAAVADVERSTSARGGAVRTSRGAGALVTRDYAASAGAAAVERTLGHARLAGVVALVATVAGVLATLAAVAAVAL